MRSNMVSHTHATPTSSVYGIVILVAPLCMVLNGVTTSAILNDVCPLHATRIYILTLE